MNAADLDVVGLLRRFARSEVELIVVGGVAAALSGSTLLTEDLDLVFHRTEKNIARILPLLTDLGATYRGVPGREVRPNADHLLHNRLNLLYTSMGRLDLLVQIGDGMDYESLLPRTRLVSIDDFEVRVLGLDALIESKRHANRPKDRTALLYLERLRELKESSED